MHERADAAMRIPDTDSDNRLEVTDLSVGFRLAQDTLAVAVDRVSFSVGKGETLALVGESGCGKSVTCLALMRLLPVPPAQVLGGQVRLSGRELLSLPEREMRRVRGTAMSMIFQEPMTSFDPVYTMGDQLSEAVWAHDPGAADAEVAERVLDAMDSVGLPNPAGLIDRYPHELSGGMKQRAMIAMALLGNPEILLCDEPTTALDVTIQAQIMELLARIRDERGMSMLFITHNLGLVAELARRAAVMYAGRIVELSPVRELFSLPLHPYSAGLLSSIPRLGGTVERLPAIPGAVPGLGNRPPGCAFAPRCAHAQAVCREVEPPLEAKAEGRLCACHFAGAATKSGAVGA